MTQQSNCDYNASTTGRAEEDHELAASNPIKDGGGRPPCVDENKTKNNIPSRLLAVGHTNKESSDEEEGIMMKKQSATSGMNLYWDNEFRRESLLKKDGCDVSSELALGTSDHLQAGAGKCFDGKDQNASRAQPHETEQLGTSSPSKSLKQASRKKRREAASAPRPALRPGAYAVPGVDSERVSIDRRNSGATFTFVASLGQNEEEEEEVSMKELKPDDAASTLHESNATNHDSLITANMVDDAEPVFEARDVRHDRFKRYMAAGTLALLALIAIVVLVVLMTSERNVDECTLEEMCCKPLDMQTSFERCSCGNNTSGMFESLSEEGHEIWDEQMAGVKHTPYWSSFGTENWDVESCNPLNQVCMHISKNEAWGLTSVQRENIPPETLDMFYFLSMMFALMDGIHWDNNHGWSRSLDVCAWYGVGCMFLDVFHELRLPDNGLSGELPPSIGEAQQLRALDLSGNNISGTIPSEISSLTNLNELKLSNLQLTGTLPPEIGTMHQLRSLSLERNLLSGSIPGAYFSLPLIQEVSLAMNNITGTLPDSLYDADQLAVLRLNGNKMTGMIPTELSNLSNLELINLGENRFSGTIPEFLGSMTRLQFTNFYHSGLTGTIPESFCQRGNGAVDFVKIVVDCSVSPPSCSCCDSHPATSKYARVTCGETVPEQAIEMFND